LLSAGADDPANRAAAAPLDRRLLEAVVVDRVAGPGRRVVHRREQPGQQQRVAFVETEVEHAGRVDAAGPRDQQWHG
jgi:hypothetical protein